MKQYRQAICVSLILAGLLLAALPADRAQAGKCINCLGTLTKDTILYTPMGRYSSTNEGILRQNGLPEVFFVGALFDGPSAAERWALVKALSQFGTFSGLQATTSNPTIAGQLKIQVPSYLLIHATYRSPYIAFVHRELYDSYDKQYQQLTPSESTLVTNLHIQFLPIIVAADYYLTRPMVLAQEFKPEGKTYSFVQLRTALSQNYKKLDALGQIVSDINSETNILVAILCHATGNRPAKTCDGPTIQKLLRHVK